MSGATQPDANVPDDRPFFVGWAKPPRALQGIIALGCLALVSLFFGVGYLLASTQSNPGDGAFRYDWGRQTVTGMLAEDPYPILHVIKSKRWPAGHVLLLSNPGKNGVRHRTSMLAGAAVEASGVAIKRGDIDMLQLRRGAPGLKPSDTTPVPLPEPQPLGRWRLVGEICDGKCYAGAMRPGAGLAHKACANLCLSGGIPPIFVTAEPVDGETFLLLADSQGNPVTDRILDHTAVPVSVEGHVERRGGILVFEIDPRTVQRAP